jgi:glycosyltransferase involved in cell wall biosynthesis
MRVAVYTIALNEKQFVKRWADSCKDADFRFILDTGSTDGTVEEAHAQGVDCMIGAV